MEQIKIGMIKGSNSLFVGKLNKLEDGIIVLNDAIEIITTIIPLPKGDGIQLLQFLTSNKIGDILDFPHDIYICELSDKSIYYIEYYKAMCIHML